MKNQANNAELMTACWFPCLKTHIKTFSLVYQWNKSSIIMCYHVIESTWENNVHTYIASFSLVRGELKFTRSSLIGTITPPLWEELASMAAVWSIGKIASQRLIELGRRPLCQLDWETSSGGRILNTLLFPLTGVLCKSLLRLRHRRLRRGGRREKLDTAAL